VVKDNDASAAQEVRDISADERNHEGDDFFARTMELRGWSPSDVSSTGSFDIGLMAVPAFGKLLDVIPIPALVLDCDYAIVFANRACGAISENYKVLHGIPFPSLVPKPRNAEKAETILRNVFTSRRNVVAEGILEMDARKIWGRLYFQSIRMGAERYLLIMIEDITSEKTQLVLKEKNDQKQKVQKSQLARIVQDRTSRLNDTSEKLCEEVFRHEQTEAALRQEEDRYNQLAENIPLASALLAKNGMITRLNSAFKEMFGCASPVVQQPETGPIAETGRAPEERVVIQEIVEWAGSSEEEKRTKTFECGAAGSATRITCTAIKLVNGDHLIVCDKL
jgi:PAS domain S-box-containing protein